MKLLAPLLLLFFLRIDTVFSVLVDPQTDTYCSYLIDRIYCAGDFGNTFGAPSDMIALDVHNTTLIETDTLKFRWERITFSNHLQVANREMAQVVSSPDRKKMFIQGGYNTQHSVISSPFLIFDATDNEWTPLPDFKRNGIIDGQIRRASVSYVSSVNKLVFYGGVTNLNIDQIFILDGIEYNSIPSRSDPFLPFGFNRLTTFDLETMQWHEIEDESGQAINDFGYAMNSFSVPGSNSVYFLGGYARSRVDTLNVTRLPFNTLSQVSFPDHQWTTHNLTSLLPMFRDFFTTTLLPDNKTVLIYGGASIEGRIIPDNEMCYLLDLDTKAWRKCPIDIPKDVGASRYSHSAVLVENNLFILFGRDSDNQLLNDIIVLDVSNIDHIKYVPEYAYQGLSGRNTKSGLGTGAIVGISVGCTAMVAIIVAVAIYGYRKRVKIQTRSIQEVPPKWHQIEPTTLNSISNSQEVTIVNRKVEYCDSTNVMKPMEIATPSKPIS